MNQKLKYYNKIEEMSDKELKERIHYSMTVPLKNTIRPIPYLGEVTEIVEYSYPELIAKCPMTSIMDLYKISIRFIPNKLIPELKSLKLYLWNYQQLPISHEHLAARILSDFKKIIKPKSLYLRLEVAGRGEIFTTIRVGDIVLEGLKPREYKNL